MKLLCTVCEAQPATLLCSADEAVMCSGCDIRVHATGKKHARAKLTSRAPSEQPKCDICQEATAFVFCREDRALLCRRCDFSVHTANKLAETHERILLANITVALHPVSASTESTSDERGHTKLSLSDEPEPCSSSLSGHLVPDGSRGASARTKGKGPMAAGESNTSEFKGAKVPDNMLPSWRVDELLDIPGLADGYGIHDVDAMVAGDLDLGDMDEFDFSYLLQVPSMDAFVPEQQAGGSKLRPAQQADAYSSDDGLGVPDMDFPKPKRGRS